MGENRQLSAQTQHINSVQSQFISHLLLSNTTFRIIITVRDIQAGSTDFVHKGYRNSILVNLVHVLLVYWLVCILIYSMVAQHGHTGLILILVTSSHSVGEYDKTT